MAGAALAALAPDADVATAGTHVIDGQPMSQRTKLALASVGLEAPGHRSRQVREDQLATADLVIALAPEHVGWVRRNHPEAADRTVTLKRLVRDGAGQDFAAVDLEPWEEVDDPAGGEQDTYDACAAEIVELIRHLVRSGQTLNRNSTTSPSRIT